MRAVLERRLDVDDHRQRVVLDDDLLGGVDDRVAVVADHERDRVADVVDLVLGERPVRRVVDLDPRRDPGHRQRRLEVEVVAGEDGVHARRTPWRRDVSIETIFACASGERTNAAHSCPVTLMSSM